MSYIETTNPAVHRDLNSKGLVVTDRAALLKSRAARSQTKRLMSTQEDIHERFASMSSRLDRCEMLLQELVRHISLLVERTPTVSTPASEE